MNLNEKLDKLNESYKIDYNLTLEETIEAIKLIDNLNDIENIKSNFLTHREVILEIIKKRHV